MEMLFLVTGALVFATGCLLGSLASSLHSWLIDEINERSPTDQQIDTFRVTEAILRRHQELCPDSAKRRQIKVAAVTALLMFIAGACLLLDYSSLHEMNRNRALAPRQQATAATIADGELAGHNQCRYRYVLSVAGSSYNGWVSEQSVEKPESRVGQHVTVYYDPEDPTVNSTVRFEYSGRERAWDLEIGVVILVSVATLILVSSILARGQKKAPESAI